MKKTLILIVTVLVLSFVAFSEVKIGVVDANEILMKTKKGVEISQRLEKLQKEKQQQLKVMQDEIKKLEKEVASPALNTETREKKAIELQGKKKDIQRYVEDSRLEIERKSQKELVALEKEIMPLINEIGKSKGFTLIMDIAGRGGIVYFDETINITPEVIKAFDAK